MNTLRETRNVVFKAYLADCRKPHYLRNFDKPVKLKPPKVIDVYSYLKTIPGYAGELIPKK